MFGENVEKKYFHCMNKSQLVQIFRSLSKKELRDFRKWVQSPSHNQREDVVLLSHFLAEHAHDQEEDALKKENVYPILYEEAYDDAKMRQVIHFTFRVLEEFLIFQAWSEQKLEQRILLASVYRKRQLTKAYERTIRYSEKLQTTYPYADHRFYEQEYLLQYEIYSYRSGLGRTVPLNLQDLSDALDIQFLANRIRLSCFMVSHQTVYKAGYDHGLLDPSVKYVRENPKMLEIPAVAIYYYIYLALTDKQNEAHFFSVKQQLFDHGHSFPQGDTRDIYLLMINYCIGRYNAGIPEFLRESFELYKNGFESGALILNGIISRWTFRNAVTNSTILKEFGWTEQFIQEYKQYLEDQHRESIVHYCMGKLHYEKGDYPEAIRQFSQVEYDDILMNLAAKVMLLKMYYELSEFAALDSLLESMRVYMHRKKVIGYHKANYENMISYTKKLVNINPYDSDQCKKLKEDMEKANPLTERKWLLSQIEMYL